MQPTNTGTDHEKERLEPGATDSSTPKPEPAAKPAKNDAALPGSPNSDLKGPKPDRGPRGAST